MHPQEPSKAEQVWSCIGIAFLILSAPVLVVIVQAMEGR